MYKKSIETVIHNPVDWETLVGIVKENTIESLSRLRRNPDQQKLYREYRAKILERYESLNDYIKITKLKFPNKELSNGKIRALENGESDKIIYVKNDFPYYLTSEIRHDVLWSIEPLDEEAIEKTIKNNIGNNVQYIWFKNPTNLQSIQDIWHIHVLSRTDI